MRIKRLLLFLLLLIPLSTYSLEYPKTNSKIVEIYDLNDNTILYEVKSNDVVSIASLTKIATAMVALENIKNLDEKVTITSSILNTVSPEAHIVGLKAGNKVTYKDLLYGTLVSSGADAANALAILSSGSIDSHVKKMNELAKRIGLEHTHFANVTGLDHKDNYGTADDVRKLLIYALKNTTFKEIYSTKKYTLSNGLVANTTLKMYDKNGTVDTSFIIGSKTGFTNAAGYCLAYLIDVNGHNMVVITLNATKSGNTYYNIVDANNLVKFMRNNYKEELLVEKNKKVKEIPVELSDIESYTITTNQEIKKYLPSDYDKTKIKIEFNGVDELDFHDHEGDKIGEISYFYGDELLTKEDVVLNQKINLNFLKLLKKYYLVVSAAIIIIVFSSIYFIKKKLNKKRKPLHSKG